MSFEKYSMHVRVDYRGGLRYLDSCGLFMVRAIDELGMMPDGNPNPQAGKMVIPEEGVSLEVNTEKLHLSQEAPVQVESISKYAEFLTNLYGDLFQPIGIDRIGVALVLL